MEKNEKTIAVKGTIRRPCQYCDKVTKCFVIDPDINNLSLLCTTCLLDLLMLKKYKLIKGTIIKPDKNAS